jgi:hypothetical protein
MAQFSATPVRMVSSTALRLGTGNAPGKPKQTGQTRVFGGWPYSTAQPHHIFVRVRRWTCISMPMIGWTWYPSTVIAAMDPPFVPLDCSVGRLVGESPMAYGRWSHLGIPVAL